MVLPADHPTHPNEPKGIRIVLEEHGLWCQNLWLKCANGCDADATSCCVTWTLSLQPDFTMQKSWVQEVIEKAGHLCIFSQSSIASWTSLSISRDQWRNTFGITVITPSTLWSRISHQPWNLSSWAQFRNGNIGWYDGWMHTGKVREPKKHSWRWNR